MPRGNGDRPNYNHARATKLKQMGGVGKLQKGIFSTASTKPKIPKEIHLSVQERAAEIMRHLGPMNHIQKNNAERYLLDAIGARSLADLEHVMVRLKQLKTTQTAKDAISASISQRLLEMMTFTRLRLNASPTPAKELSKPAKRKLKQSR